MSKLALPRLHPAAMSVLLLLAGLILVSIGIGMIYAPAGVIVAGLGAFYLESRTGG